MACATTAIAAEPTPQERHTTMTNIYADNSLSIGRTPLVRLNRIAAGQVMITCCEDGISEKLRAGAAFHIQNGKIV